MISFFWQKKNFLQFSLIWLFGFFTSFFYFPTATEGKTVVKSSNLGVIKGIVRDEQGNPISDAVVAIFRASKILKQVRSSADGSFVAKIVPGTYSILAVAQGFNPVTLPEIQVNRASQLNYGFKLERSGVGKTLPEKRVDRDSSKWRIRAAQSRRSIYQAKESAKPIEVEESIAIAQEEEEKSARKNESVIETFVAVSEGKISQGVNFATVQSLNEKTDIILAGQTGTSSKSTQRAEVTLKFRPNEKNQISLKTSVGNIGKIKTEKAEKNLGQFSLQAINEIKVKDGVILVVGLDYAKFIGGGDDFSLSPRFGLQFDIDNKTRLRTAYTTQNEEKTWAQAIEFEDSQVIFREPLSVQQIAVVDKKPVINKSRRLEFGIERVLDNNSSFEATAFFDAISGRGVGFSTLPIDFLNVQEIENPIANQQGKTHGLRMVYNRRLSKNLSTSFGYSLGSGQKISQKALTNPTNIFENDFFQTFFGQLNAQLRRGTKVKTVFRLSPQATVFAIDPFQGRLAIYDPSLSVLVTQALPTLGLPVKAEAILDARNILDYQTGISGENGTLTLNSQRRLLRGGIMVRF